MRDEKYFERVSEGLRPGVGGIANPSLSRQPVESVRKGPLKCKDCDTPRRDKTIACVNLACVLDNGDISPESS